MDELVNLVAQRTGLSADQSRAAAETVIGFLKERLPAPIAAHMDGVIAGRAATQDGGIGGMMGEVGGLGSIARGLGGMFGEKP